LQSADFWTHHLLSHKHHHGERALPLGILFDYSVHASQSEDLKPSKCYETHWGHWKKNGQNLTQMLFHHGGRLVGSNYFQGGNEMWPKNI